MIRLWQISDDDDIVEFKFKIENDNSAGIVMYSRSRKATMFTDSLIDSYPDSYSYRIRKYLFDAASDKSFPKQHTIAWY